MVAGNVEVKAEKNQSGLGFIKKVLIKVCVLLIFFNLIFVGFDINGKLGSISMYNWIFPGRERFPFGENQVRAYNVSLYDIQAMFVSHRISGKAKAKNEYRVILIGDSSIWGTLLRPQDTLAGRLDNVVLKTCDGKQIRFYNLGYPTLSLAKDLMMLQGALEYQPDLIIWSITLEALPVGKQITSPIVVYNPKIINDLITQYGLNLDSSKLIRENIWDKTVIGSRRALADWLHLQVYGVLWAATGIDQTYLNPGEYQPAQRDLEPDEVFQDMLPPVLPRENMSFDILKAGIKMVGNIPLVLVNEPILISQGKNSNIRYNFFYPRWAYDDYRKMLTQMSQEENWRYYDFWDIIPETEFTNSAIHLTPSGSEMLAFHVADALRNEICINK
jgi:hypothetical protein